MAMIKVEMSMPPVDGMDIKFKAPCDCTQITGLLVEYPEGSKEFTFRDCHGNNLAGIGNLFGAGAYIKVIVDVGKGYAYLQNADNNGFLNSAVLGTYTHDGENLTGFGENGKFKATTSGAISTINVNGVACSIRCGEESSIDLITGNWYTFILDGDTVNFSSGGAGGGGLDFQIVGNPRPVSPKENTIWANTDVEITGCHLSATATENPTAGMLWIKISDSSNVEIGTPLGKDYITINLDSVSQYVGGSWVDVEAKSFQNGVWVEWFEILYPNGELSEWSVGYKQTANGSLTISDGDLVLTSTSTGSGELRTVFYAKNQIDVSNISLLSVKMTINTNRGSWRVALIADATSINPQGNTVCEIQNEGTGEWDANLDVSNVSGKYYFIFYYTSWSATSNQTHSANVHTIATKQKG